MNEQVKSIQEHIDAMSPEIKDYWLSIFFMLNRSDRYKNFVDANFQIDQVIDEENKMIDTRVQEKEPPPFEFDNLQKMKLLLLCKNYNCSDPGTFCEKVANLIAGKKVGDAPLIKKATSADVDAELKARDLKKGLDA